MTQEEVKQLKKGDYIRGTFGIRHIEKARIDSYGYLSWSQIG